MIEADQDIEVCAKATDQDYTNMRNLNIDLESELIKKMQSELVLKLINSK